MEEKKKIKIKKFEDTAKRKFDDPWRYLYAFVIALFLLTFGFLASYAISSFEFNRVSSIQEDVFYDFYKKQVFLDLSVDLNKCDFKVYDEIGGVLDFQGSMLSQLEQELGKRDREIQEKKENYFLLQLSHYNLMKELNEECGFEKNFILFFYSNQNSDLDNSKNIGRILSSLKSMDDSVMVYSFDRNSESDLMKFVRSKYGIEGEIKVLINEEIKLTNVRNVDELLELLK